jgi:metal-responsive CopG/Arc/MetJ family transcriptional regulator
MGTSSVNISFKDDLLNQIDSIARDESRSRSELIREATRIYIERKKRWGNIFKFGKQQASHLGLCENDIEKEIKSCRKRK